MVSALIWLAATARSRRSVVVDFTKAGAPEIMKVALGRSSVAARTAVRNDSDVEGYTALSASRSVSARKAWSCPTWMMVVFLPRPRSVMSRRMERMGVIPTPWARKTSSRPVPAVVKFISGARNLVLSPGLSAASASLNLLPEDRRVPIMIISSAGEEAIENGFIPPLGMKRSPCWPARNPNPRLRLNENKVTSPPIAWDETNVRVLRRGRGDVRRDARRGASVVRLAGSVVMTVPFWIGGSAGVLVKWGPGRVVGVVTSF